MGLELDGDQVLEVLLRRGSPEIQASISWDVYQTAGTFSSCSSGCACFSSSEGSDAVLLSW